MAGYVERGVAPGLVSMVSRRGEVHVDAIGMKAVGGNDPMRRDTIFRISSMSKPVVAAAAMILVEEGTLRLDDPVDRLLPELANRRVLKRLDGPLDEVVPAKRPITVRDLLTFRMGLGLIFAEGDYPILQEIQRQQITGFGPPDPLAPHDPDEWMRRLGTLPLMHQPGERWMYNIGACVLGVLMARAAGQPLEASLRERLFEPLGMKDTGFSVPPEKHDRLATAYLTDPAGGALIFYDGVEDGRWSRPPVFPDGAAGMVSTIDDFAAFGEMLRNKGRHGERRILSRLSVEVMTTDQITPEQKAASAFVPGFWDRHGWGFGLAIKTRRDDVAAVPGRFGWDGGLGSRWSSDPVEEMTTILMTQASWTSPNPPDICLDFWTGAYAAIED
jgi:CubicO group peptidase (beta-lactamase class C family)